MEQSEIITFWFSHNIDYETSNKMIFLNTKKKRACKENKLHHKH